MPEEVTPEGFERLKLRVHGLADKMQEAMIQHAELKGRVDSAEGSIDRLIQTSASAEQVNSLSTIVTLKLDHLLERQHDMRRQISWSTRLVFLLFACGVLALLYVAFR